MSSQGERCVLTLPLLTEPFQDVIIEKRFKIMEHLQNSLIAYELRKLKNLERTRAYRELCERIRNASDKERKTLSRQRSKMLKEAGFSEYQFQDDITPMQKHFVEHILSMKRTERPRMCGERLKNICLGPGKWFTLNVGARYPALQIKPLECIFGMAGSSGMAARASSQFG